MDIVFGLAASVSYGATDFLGGLAARRTPSLSVVVLSQAIGLLSLLIAIPIIGSAPISTHAVLWGSAGGVVGSLGLVFLYRGLSRGRMSVVAPVAAVIGASIPVVVDLAAAQSVDAVSLGGVGLALCSLAFVSSGPAQANPDDEGGRTTRFPGRGLFDAVLAGLGIAGFLIFFSRAGEVPGLWPLATSRIASIIALGIGVLASTPIRRSVLSPTWLVLPIAALDTMANFFYLLASREGVLAIAAVLTSLYPATTVLLARSVLNERIGKLQALGLGLAVAGVTLIALS